MSDSVLKKFGKYFLLDRIGEGGMAEIFRSRLATPDGSGRLLVIKRILGANNANPEFVQMFKSEVQVTMRFTHPNIVQLYEAGDEHEQPYIAMEFVDGRNLRQVLAKLSNKHQRLPVQMVCYLIEQTAQGLHYAHSFKDRITGEPLQLVHRDVSPQNILLSFDGNVKVIDFGIAKASVNGEATRAGVIKGKLSYLSPEQVMGEKLDPRSDVFALGIVMWELLTGKRLFVADGENEFQVLKMIESCNTFVKPPSTLNKEIPKELDQIVMLALARDPAKRYQSADDLARALRKFLTSQYPDYSVSDLSLYIKKLFHEHIVEDRKMLQQLNQRAEELIRLGLNTANLQEKAPSGDGKEHTRVTQFMGDKFDRSQITNADKVEVAAHPQRQVRVGPQKGTNGSTAVPPMKRNTYTAPQPVAEEQSSGGGLLKGILSVAMLGAVAVGGYWYWNEHMNPNGASHVVRDPQSMPVSAERSNVAQITLKINLFPDGDVGNTRITVNNQPIDSTSRKTMVPIGELIEIRVDRPGYASFRQEFSLREADVGDAKEWVKDIKLEPMKYGRFSLDSIPSFADVRIVRTDQDGRSPGSQGDQGDSLVLKTPFMGERLPAGNYRVIVENKALGMEKNFTISIEEGKELRPSNIHLDIKK